MGPDNEIWVILHILSLHARRTKYLKYVYAVFARAFIFIFYKKYLILHVFLYFCRWNENIIKANIKRFSDKH